MTKITQKLLHDLFEYRDGDLIRKTKPAKRNYIGEVAGFIDRGLNDLEEDK